MEQDLETGPWIIRLGIRLYIRCETGRKKRSGCKKKVPSFLFLFSLLPQTEIMIKTKR